ncbi:MAG: PDZ domain-containing protein [Anaerolineales bacterium]|nr:PDZ domain-containing protein [Anaerolineales bacterium]
MSSTVSCASPTGSYPGPALGVVVDEQFTVLDVKSGSTAELAGVQAGDVLLTLDGTGYTSPAEWAIQVGNIEIGKTYTLEVQRGSSVISVTVTSARDSAGDFPPGATPTVIPTGQFYF